MEVEITRTRVAKVASLETNKEVDQDTTIPRITPGPIYSNHRKQVTKFLKRKVRENQSAETEVANRITKVTEEEIMITEILTTTTKIDQLEEEGSKTNQPEELDQTQEDSKDQLVELHSMWQLALSKTLRCLKRR